MQGAVIYVKERDIFSDVELSAEDIPPDLREAPLGGGFPLFQKDWPPWAAHVKQWLFLMLQSL